MADFGQQSNLHKDILKCSTEDQVMVLGGLIDELINFNVKSDIQ